ncbi:hypothetical protein KJ611_01185 [Patescibacteria group bacterium]|nr:hypothetical protein [Patescibacteria group bacterium]MBU1705297.1 hypothetical protein [Patescibacteria group bacterium]
MKKLIIVLSVLALIGAGCNWGKSEPAFVGTAYENSEYSFAFDYPETMDVHSRDPGLQPYKYLGMDVQFFASVRDVVKDAQPTNLAFLLASPRLTADDFRAKLEASGAADLQEVETVKINDLTMYKFTNATAMDPEIMKYHYLFDRGDQTIIISVFVGEFGPFEPVLSTFRSFK